VTCPECRDAVITVDCCTLDPDASSRVVFTTGTVIALVVATASTSNPLLYAGMKPAIPSEKSVCIHRGERMHSFQCISDSEFNSKISTPAIPYIIDLP
jgi:ribonuclease PH